MLRLVLFLALTAQCVLADCNKGWVEFNDFCFGFSNETMNWFLAASTCNYYGARLVQIESQTKHDWLVAQVKALKFGNTWLGASKRYSGTWEWIPSFKSINVYSNWATGEPNNPTTELCLTFNAAKEYKWNDAICSYNFSFVCEKRVNCK